MLNSAVTIKSFYYYNTHCKIFLGHEPGLFILEAKFLGVTWRALSKNVDLWNDVDNEAEPVKMLLARRTIYRLIRLKHRCSGGFSNWPIYKNCHRF